MAGYNPDRDRKVIPRLRRFRDSRGRGDLDALERPRGFDARAAGLIASKVEAWKRHRTIGHGTDLVGAAVTLGRVDADVRAAARALVFGDREVTTWAMELGRIALGLDMGSEGSVLSLPFERRLESSTLYSQVRTSRMLLRQEPNDPITWVDLAFAYVSLGRGAQAERSIMTAVQLAPDNRFVLRSAGRLWVHLGDPEKAHGIVARSRRTLEDPWLLAAEIALGSIVNRGRRNVKAARRLLGRGRFSAVHTSELASALATLELNAGSIKKAKKLFEQSLREPTENSIAQAIWAGRQSKGISIRKYSGEHANAFEADSWSRYMAGQWEEATVGAARWFGDQPFSRRPPGHGSFVAAVGLQDYRKSKWFAENGLRANPYDFTLLNNFAFACLNLGELSAAKSALDTIAKRVATSKHQSIVFAATRGLYAFRTGQLEQGRLLYNAACDNARRVNGQIGKRIHAFAAMFHALEELAIGGPESEKALTRALRAFKDVSDPIAKTLIARLKSR